MTGSARLLKLTIFLIRRLSVFAFILFASGSCILPQISSSTPQTPTQQITPTSITQETLVTFRLTLQQAIQPGESILLTVVDEVTGLAINPKSVVMEAEDSTHYSVMIPFHLGRVVKYRYIRQGGSNIQEHLMDGRPVRYRLYHVEGPGIVQDVISRWTDTQFSGNTGRITGQITDNTSGQPIPNLLIVANGAQTLTRADGSYIIEGLPTGTHNLVAHALDGMYHTYQQGAIIAADSTTPASFTLNPSSTVPVVFTVSVPESTPHDSTLRLAGNLYQLGNTFSDLSGGISTLASHMPTFTMLPDGRYVTSINLPVGAYIEYKYTLGDGLWNAEHAVDGSFLTRHLIISDTTSHVEDRVDNWGLSQAASIRFDVTIPSYTPPDDVISIQINPGYGWLEPLPMWSTNDTQGNPIWRFILLSPLDVSQSIQYRICRSDQCGIADDSSTQGDNPVGHVVTTGLLPQAINYSVPTWVWYPSQPEQASVPNVTIIPRTGEFLTGIGFIPAYHPSWDPYFKSAIDMSATLGANLLMIRPTWTFISDQPLVFDILTSQDPMVPLLITQVTHAASRGMNTYLFPTPNFPIASDQWWQETERDYAWWVVWFEQYAQFVLHHAYISNQEEIEGLVIGGSWVTPALPGGKLSDMTSSGVPADAENRWRSMIEQIREHYDGRIVWALTYPDGVRTPPPFIEAVDQVMILWSPPLTSEENPSITDLQTEATRILDEEIYPFIQEVDKPVILAIEYPSADGSAIGCAVTPTGACIPDAALTTLNSSLNLVSINMQEQADLYNATLLAVNDRDWISGLISMGFYPPVPLQDPSVSVYNKPAGGVLWYWFPRLLGIEP